jgi:hypothetical protein
MSQDSLTNYKMAAFARIYVTMSAAIERRRRPVVESTPIMCAD